MNLTIAWNVWSNYADLLLGSEIARLENDRVRAFERLHLISQGGYPEPPSAEQARYLDTHQVVTVDESIDYIKNHPMGGAYHRVLTGLKLAYDWASMAGSDFALVTNADAWCLDLMKLKRLLEREDIARSAVSVRIGLVTALEMTFGDFVPFFDDHFIIVNVRRCRELGVFAYQGTPKTYEAHFLGYGGIHYLFIPYLDEVVPPGMLHVYSDSSDCLNHFGERSGYSLLPWQYQPAFGFLHSNDHEEPAVGLLRAELFRHLGLAAYPAVGGYCEGRSAATAGFSYTADGVHFRQPWHRRAKIRILFEVIRSYYRVLRLLKYKRFAAVKQQLCGGDRGTLVYFERYWDVLPLTLSSRRS